MSTLTHTLCFGFNPSSGGIHTSRTIMLDEIEMLFAQVSDIYAPKDAYYYAVVAQNCLAKRSNKNTILTYKHLTSLYTLDPSVVIFRTLRYFWELDVIAHPLILFLCAYVRDPLLYSVMPFLFSFTEGESVSRQELENFIEAKYPERFSSGTLKSTAQNINSTWTKSGYLQGRSRKIRSQATATAGSVSYALFLGYLAGYRGELLFQSEYIKLLDCTYGKAIDLAEEASAKNWIDLKRIGNIIEVKFPNLLTKEERELVYE